MPPGRARLLPLLLIPVALLAQPAALFPTATYYVRDFSLTYLPLRVLWAREAAAGRWAFWNPYNHEGALTLPVFYPVEWLHALCWRPEFISWLLTLHLPLAALAAYALARELGARRAGAFLSGAGWALCGIALSSLNLHWYLHALAWAPLCAALLRRAAVRGGASLPLAAVVVAVSISTLAGEFAGQGILLGLLLAIEAAPRQAWRAALAVALGAGLAGLPIALTLGVLAQTGRGAGFPEGVRLANSVHPFTLLQVLVPGLYGEPLAGLWYMRRFFSLGFPYLQSWYLGVPLLALAAAGVSSIPRGPRVVLLGAAGLGLWYALGPWGGLAGVVSGLPLARSFRYPCKAMLLPCLAAVLLAGAGLDRLRRGEGLATLRAAVAGLTAPVLGLLLWLAAGWGSFAHFLGKDPAAAAPARPLLVAQCLLVMTVAGLAWVAAWGAERGRIAPARAGMLLLALVVVDLARSGAEVNPQVAPAYYRLRPPLAALGLNHLEGGRVFSYEALTSTSLGAYYRAVPSPTALWEDYMQRQVQGSYLNVLDGVEAAEDVERLNLGLHPTGLAASDPQRFAEILPWLRQAAVTRVLSLDPVADPALIPLARVPAGPPPLAVYAYALRDPWPRAYVACRVIAQPDRARALRLPLDPAFDPARDVVLAGDRPASCGSGRVLGREVSAPGAEAYEVDTDGAGLLVTRDSFAAGWSATVDGQPAPVLLANGKHRAVPVPGGRHRVRLGYQPPGLVPGLAISSLSGLVVAGLAWRFRPRHLAGPPSASNPAPESGA